MADLSGVSAADAEFHASNYRRFPVLFVEGRGMRLYDDAGKEYLDFVAGIGSVNLGHAHPAVTKALCEQAAKLVQVSNLYHVEHRAELARELVALMGGGYKVWFQNSGAEAVEGAIKLARKWAKENKGEDVFEIVTCERGFHGRTLTALSATAQPEKQKPFEPMTPGFRYVPFNDLDALEQAVTERTCAVMIEPVQGEGGVWPCSPGYLAGVEHICREKNVLLVLDEVQTGFYRTGPVFAHKAFGVTPDIMTLAKSLANGLPIGAVLARSVIADVFRPGDHGSTFAGGPAICAAARATLAALAGERLGENAVSAGDYLRSGLEALAEQTDAISQVRGVGLMNAVQLEGRSAPDIVAAALGRGLVLNATGPETLRFLPPLLCGRQETDTLVGILEELIS